jgi:hypothetical protein
VELFEKGSAPLNLFLNRVEKILVFFNNRFKSGQDHPEFRENRVKTTSNSDSEDRVETVL